MILVIAEKPSVAKQIAQVIGANKQEDGYLSGNGYYVSWAIGHLVGLASVEAYGEQYQKWRYEDLPILPVQWKHEVLSDTKKQFSVLKKLMNTKEVTELVAATDAGREGELIFRLIYEQARCEKPFKRLWISSMEEKAIKSGFENLKDGHCYDALYESALCRSQADWIVGINATRLFSCLYRKVLRVGRVQSPTLAMLVEREEAIRSFQPKPYFIAHIGVGDLIADSEPFDEEREALELARMCQGKEAQVQEVLAAKKTVNPPKLYDLTTLQRDANRLFAFTAQQTLDYTQSLYEQRLVTYPRTDSQYLTEDMKDAVGKLREIVKVVFPFKESAENVQNTENFFDSKKVSDHHAILPTEQVEGKDFLELPEGERKILFLIAWRLLAASAAPYIYESIQAKVLCQEYCFLASGTVCVQEGWKVSEKEFSSVMKLGNEKKKREKKPLPSLEKGQLLTGIEAGITEHQTTPPKRFTEDTLLAAMERAGNEELEGETEKRGLGTPATRAATIEKLVQSGMVQRKDKVLLPTSDGINLVTILPKTIKSPQMTAQWEMQLTEIAKGKTDGIDFLEGIRQMVSELVETYHAVREEEKQRFASERQVVGKCPRCGAMVVETKQGYFCDNRENCRFGIWKNNKFFQSAKKEVTPQIARELLQEGKTFVKGLYSEKKQKKYDAMVVLDDTGQYVNFKLEFPTGKKKAGNKRKK